MTIDDELLDMVRINILEYALGNKKKHYPMGYIIR
jgi:hypothetical protein